MKPLNFLTSFATALFLSTSLIPGIYSQSTTQFMMFLLLVFGIIACKKTMSPTFVDFNSKGAGYAFGIFAGVFSFAIGEIFYYSYFLPAN